MSTVHTFKTASAACKAVGLMLKRSDIDGEYRLNTVGGRELTAYYTIDLGDAVGIAGKWVRAATTQPVTHIPFLAFSTEQTHSRPRGRR